MLSFEEQIAVAKEQESYDSWLKQAHEQAKAHKQVQQIQQQQQQMQTQNTAIQNALSNTYANIYQPMGTSATNWTMTTTGKPSYDEDLEVSRIVKKDSNGYFYAISVDADDEVFYRVWKGGFIPYAFAKIFGRFGMDIEGNRGSWISVNKRSHLPATLGAAYEAIESAINEDMEEREHNKYITQMLKTKPDALKMIEGLERLENPDTEPMPEQPVLNGSGAPSPVGGYTYSTLPGSSSNITFNSTVGTINPLKCTPGGNVEVEGSLTVGGKSIEEMVKEQLDASHQLMLDSMCVTEENDKGETKNG